MLLKKIKARMKKDPGKITTNTEDSDNREYVSFSEVDKNGVFREAYGYFEKNTDGKTTEERVAEMREYFGKKG